MSDLDSRETKLVRAGKPLSEPLTQMHVALSVRIDNPTAQWLHLGNTQEFIAPGTMGAIRQLPEFDQALADWTPPAGVVQGALVPAQVAVLTYYSYDQDPSPGLPTQQTVIQPQVLLGQFQVAIGATVSKDFVLPLGTHGVQIARGAPIGQFTDWSNLQVTGIQSGIFYVADSSGGGHAINVAPISPVVDTSVRVSATQPVASPGDGTVWVIAILDTEAVFAVSSPFGHGTNLVNVAIDPSGNGVGVAGNNALRGKITEGQVAIGIGGTIALIAGVAQQFITLFHVSIEMLATPALPDYVLRSSGTQAPVHTFFNLKSERPLYGLRLPLGEGLELFNNTGAAGTLQAASMTYIQA